MVGNVWLGGRTPGNGSFPVTFTGYVEHEAALREMRAATALLFYAPASTWAPSGKIFEYLISRRPILAVARPDNLAHQLVDELGAGAVAEPDDPDGIVRALVDLYHRWTAGTLAVSDDVAARTLERFSRRKLTEDLSRVMHSAIDGRKTS